MGSVCCIATIILQNALMVIYNNAWLETFQEKNGRPLRVLHYGNIANNGYLNAKALRRQGVEADVLCHDYHHIMGCPEWEDGDIDGDWGDDFAPNWSGIVHDFELPDWFHRGPLADCISAATDLCDRRDGITPGADEVGRPWYFRVVPGIYRRYREFVQSPRTTSYFARHPRVFFWLRFTRNQIMKVVHLAMRVMDFFKLSEAQKVARLAVEQIDEDLPERRGQAKMHRLVGLSNLALTLRPLLDRYDVVHAYATNPVPLMLSGKRPYVAYEHGTIRQMPFERTTEGASLTTAYRSADGVVITNCDNKLAAEKMGLRNFEFVPHPVNEDYLSRSIASDNLRQRLVEEHDASFILFHPSRQHWSEERDPSLEKGNDILIRGFARLVNEVDPRAFAVMVDWGLMVDRSKALLEELGCADRVTWIRPLPHRAFAKWINASDVVADQFYLGAFGSLTPKAMACGKPVLLNLDEELHRWCFQELPPVMNVKTPDEVFHSLQNVVLDKRALSRIGEEGRGWYNREHSMKLVGDKLVGMYQHALEA